MAKDGNFVLDESTCKLIKTSENIIMVAEENFEVLGRIATSEPCKTINNVIHLYLRGLNIQNRVIIDQNTEILKRLSGE